MRGDVAAIVAVFDERRLATFIPSVRETRHEHAARQRIRAMWTYGATGRLLEVLDGLHQPRPVRLGIHVEDEDLAAIEPAEPKLSTVIGEPAVMRLKSSANRLTVNDLAVVRRTWLDVHRDELVRAVA